jgi:recombination protein RecT
MMRIVMTAILNNPTLALCEPTSFFGALLQALQLGLEVNTPLGQAYLIPRRKKGKDGSYYWTCNFQLGYQGLLDLCYRYHDDNGKSAYRQITAMVVYAGDDFDYKLGTHQFLHHIPRDKGDTPTHVWALYELDNGGQRFVVWTWEKVMKHAEQFSESYDDEKKTWKYSAWSSNQESRESMGQKTVLHDLLKYAPKSVELAQAVSADGNTIIAHPISEGNDTKFQFDVQPPQIEAPNDGLKVPRQKAPVAEEADGEVKDKEPEPVSRPAARARQGKGNALFPRDEEEAMEDQYQRSQTGPIFGN